MVADVAVCASAGPQVLCVIPIPILRWILVGAAGLSSGYFL
jgi:hypothetical protein